jgi:hypothetical protein
MTEVEQKKIGRGIIEFLEEQGASPVDMVSIYMGVLISLLMAVSDTKEEAFDGWAALTVDARNAISLQFDRVKAATQSGDESASPKVTH